MIGPNCAKIISVVTPSLNQGEFISEAIESVLSQAGNFYIDYAVIDGGSTDGSVEIIADYERLIKKGRWPVRCLGINYRWISEPDDGQVHAINKGFAQAKGEILAWLNSDDIYYPGTFQKISQKNWKRTDFCYGKGMWISRKGEDISHYPTFSPNKYFLHRKCTLCQPTVFFTKQAFMALGPLSDRYCCTFDYDFWLRAVFHGHKFSFISALLAKSRMYAQNKSLLNQRLAEREAAALHHRYYRNERLNPIALTCCSWIVGKLTKKREEILEREIDIENHQRTI